MIIIIANNFISWFYISYVTEKYSESQLMLI